MITIKENVKSVKEYNYLFDSVGWGSYEEEVSKKHWKIQYIQFQCMMMKKL